MVEDELKNAVWYQSLNNGNHNDKVLDSMLCALFLIVVLASGTEI